MSILRPTVIAPDSSHWAKWLDAMSAPDPARRDLARSFHEKLINAGRIPLLSLHHMEELLAHDDAAKASSRVARLQAFRIIAWQQLKKNGFGLASEIQIRAAELVAAYEGSVEPIAIRDQVRDVLLQSGTGVEAIGENQWVWELARSTFRKRKEGLAAVAAFGPMRSFDESKTIGELSRARFNSPAETEAQMSRVRDDAYHAALNSVGGDSARAAQMADEFVIQAFASMPDRGMTVRDFLLATLVEQGVDEAEVLDDCILADLRRLGVYRSQLKVIAPETGLAFEDLKGIDMRLLPSWLVSQGLTMHGQFRSKRPGSDVTDRHLATLAPYCDVFYADKRTVEDFRRATRKERALDGLIGEVAKASDFDALLG